MPSTDAMFPSRSSAASAPAAVFGAHLYQIRDLIYQIAGILQPDHRLEFLEKRCQKRMSVVGAASLRDYYDFLTRSANRTTELTQLLNEITIGETFFFRNLPQIEALRKVILPAIVENKRRLPFSKLRVWSAGCSTGEEAY